jgi:L,D-peptidoglycan transpeptidase YkuD (ErfK/YbiS/YcfS/YnhG family)
MNVARVLSTTAVVVAIGAAAALVIAVSGATPHPSADSTSTPLPSTASSERAVPDESTSASETTGTPTSTAPTAAASLATALAPAPVTTSAGPAAAPVATAPAATHAVTHPATVAPPAPAPVTGQALPLGYSTGSATRVITVVAASTGSTVATLQAWDKAPGGGWLRHGSAVTAHVGADGLSTSPSETRSATPIGSFSLTQSFGALGNPGTGLPYFQTTTADWWISESGVGALYNTHQRCSGSCPFTQGDPNEHLITETPFYNYAVVIDYNTANAGTVRQGGGSAFFLHVTNGTPTAGCVAIAQASLVPIMQWLTPAAAPRILIGVA